MTDKAADIARMSFEDALAELERIVATLEKGQAPSRNRSASTSAARPSRNIATPS